MSAVPGLEEIAAPRDAAVIYPHGHRIAAHSVTAVVLVAALTAAAGGGSDVCRGGTTLLLSGAYGTHELADWLGVDTGPPLPGFVSGGRGAIGGSFRDWTGSVPSNGPIRSRYRSSR